MRASIQREEDFPTRGLAIGPITPPHCFEDTVLTGRSGRMS
jgi:hypothetical protein